MTTMSSLPPTTTLVTNHTVTQDNGSALSVPPHCVAVKLDERGFLPWDNPDNIVSAQVEEVSRRVKDAYLLPGLFLVGGPANVINLLVFYKQGLRDRINLCLFALSLADELYLIQAMFIFAEQTHLQFTTQDRYGPMGTFMANHNLVGFYGFTWVSQVLSAIIATERCLCIVSPLTFRTLLSTRAMAVVVTAVFVVVIGVYMLVAARYRVGCVYDVATGTAFRTYVAGEFYQRHAEAINYLDGFVFGAGLPGLTIIVVVVTTTVTTVKLRQVVAWRALTSSCGNQSEVSAREVAVTRMLIGNSLLFIVCVAPIALFRFVWLFLPEMTAGGRHHNFFFTSLWLLEVVSYVNSSLNFFVYYAMGSHYRQTFRAVFCRKKAETSPPKPTTISQLSDSQ